VGAYCSIAPEVRILAGSEHVMTRVTTFPLNALLFEPGGGNARDAIDKGVTEIGHDVWIGLGAVVLSGVSVGHGAVIGARAVVSKGVPPYAVVVGNPARIIGYRFGPEVRRRILALGWWEWLDDDVFALKSSFLRDVGSFLRDAERLHRPIAEDELTRRLREASPSSLTRDSSQARTRRLFRRPRATR
jgi:hypothetical protein